eukprot:764478-Hanusia_phi.AAC.1
MMFVIHPDEQRIHTGGVEASRWAGEGEPSQPCYLSAMFCAEDSPPATRQAHSRWPQGVRLRVEIAGPGGPYNCFAGRDASRMLGKMQTEPGARRWRGKRMRRSTDALDPSTADFEEKELHRFDAPGHLLAHRRDSLNHWEKFFSDKYSVVGTINDS